MSKSTKHTLPVTVSLVIPVYNEADVITPFMERIESVFHNNPSVELEFVFVNDGSTDATLQKVLEYQQSDPRVVAVDLSRNFGKEAALSAGLEASTGRVVVPIDVDLQDPPELILDMLEKWQEGYEVVLARRYRRSSDSWLKKTTAHWFYRLHNRIADPVLPENVGDFRLMDRSVVDAIGELPESRRFMKGLFAWVGFHTAHVDYDRQPRVGGSSKFNGWRLWNFALEGITSFSTSPLRIWSYIGFTISMLSFAFAAFVVLRWLTIGADVPGYASLIVAVTFLGGLQLMGIGILGEYVGRTYIESKRRPVYLVRRLYRVGED